MHACGGLRHAAAWSKMSAGYNQLLAHASLEVICAWERKWGCRLRAGCMCESWRAKSLKHAVLGASSGSALTVVAPCAPTMVHIPDFKSMVENGVPRGAGLTMQPACV